MNNGMLGAAAASTVPTTKMPTTTTSALAGPHRSAARPVAGSEIIAARADALNAKP